MFHVEHTINRWRWRSWTMWQEHKYRSYFGEIFLFCRTFVVCRSIYCVINVDFFIGYTSEITRSESFMVFKLKLYTDTRVLVSKCFGYFFQNNFCYTKLVFENILFEKVFKVEYLNSLYNYLCSTWETFQDFLCLYLSLSSGQVLLIY